MANIRENARNGKTVSYRFTTCLGRDSNGKQIRRYTTWDIPMGLTPAKARKAAERAADAWEQDIRQEYEKQCALTALEKTYVAYRKAGYSKKSLAEHESEIAIHKAARTILADLASRSRPPSRR